MQTPRVVPAFVVSLSLFQYVPTINLDLLSTVVLTVPVPAIVVLPYLFLFCSRIPPLPPPVFAVVHVRVQIQPARLTQQNISDDNKSALHKNYDVSIRNVRH